MPDLATNILSPMQTNVLFDGEPVNGGAGMHS